MRQINSCAKILLFLLIFIYSALTITVFAHNKAENQQTFKKGDHVLASPLGLKNEKYWRRCIVVEVMPGGYSLECEAERKGGSPSSFIVGKNWVKSALAEVTTTKPDNDAANNKSDDNQSTGLDPQMSYKVGDRVEIDVIMSRNPQKSIYKKGTITEVSAEDKSYVINVDPLPGKLPQPYRVPIREYGKHWIRAIQGADNAPKTLTEKLRADENGTVLADREIMKCQNFAHNGRNGSPPPTELAKKLIRCIYEKPSENGMDGATTMDITGFTIDAPHRWKVYEDIGQGTANTLVYPIHVKWNQKTFYRTRNIVKTNVEGNYTCFVDKTNLWQCGHAAGAGKEGQTQEISVKR